MPLACGLPSFAAYLLVKARTVSVANRVAAFFAGLTDGHLATRLLFVRFAFGGFCHWLTPVEKKKEALGRLAFEFLTAFLPDYLVKRRAILFFGRFPTFAANRLVELGPVLSLNPLAPTLACFTNGHAASGPL
jgi:hypothetical protein